MTAADVVFDVDVDVSSVVVCGIWSERVKEVVVLRVRTVPT